MRKHVLTVALVVALMGLLHAQNQPSTGSSGAQKKAVKVFVDPGKTVAFDQSQPYTGEALGKACPGLSIVRTPDAADVVIKVIRQAQPGIKPGYEWETFWGKDHLSETAKTLHVALEHSCITIVYQLPFRDALKAQGSKMQ